MTDPTARRLRNIARLLDTIPRSVVNRPTDNEVCPCCDSKRIVDDGDTPPMRCLDCGDQWAGIYLTDTQ